MSYNLYGQVSALDFLHFTLLEYQRLQLKAYHDEEITHRQRERKLDEITVPAIDDMFYKDPAIIIRNFDYEHAVFLPASNYQTNQTGDTVININENLLRLAVPSSRFQNNPPKTREELRMERKRKENEKDNPPETGFSKQPQKIMRVKANKNAKPLMDEDKELNDRSEVNALKGSKNPKVISRIVQNNNTASTIFKDDLPSSIVRNPDSRIVKFDGEQDNKNKEIFGTRNDESPSKTSSRANLGISPSTQKLLGIGSDRGHTSSYRSLYAYGSRGQDTPQKEENKETRAAPEPDSDNDSHKDDFSSILYNTYKPSFLLHKSEKKARNEEKEVESLYRGNHNGTKSPPPKLPPRDSPDLEQSEEKIHFGGEYSKSNNSHYPSKHDIENNLKSKREGDREKRISVLDDVEDF